MSGRAPTKRSAHPLPWGAERSEGYPPRARLCTWWSGGGPPTHAAGERRIKLIHRAYEIRCHTEVRDDS